MRTFSLLIVFLALGSFTFIHAADSDFYETFVGLWKPEKCEMSNGHGYKKEGFPHDWLKIEAVQVSEKTELEVYLLNKDGVETKNVVTYSAQYKKENPFYKNVEIEILQKAKVMGKTIVVGTVNSWTDENTIGLYFTTLSLNADGSLNYERKGMTTTHEEKLDIAPAIWHLKCTFEKQRKLER